MLFVNLLRGGQVFRKLFSVQTLQNLACKIRETKRSFFVDLWGYNALNAKTRENSEKIRAAQNPTIGHMHPHLSEAEGRNNVDRGDEVDELIRLP